MGAACQHALPDVEKMMSWRLANVGLLTRILEVPLAAGPHSGWRWQVLLFATPRVRVQAEGNTRMQTSNRLGKFQQPSPL